MSDEGDDAVTDVSLPLAPGLSESLVEEASAAVGDLFEGPGGGTEHLLNLDPHMHSHRGDPDPGPLGQDVSEGRMAQVGYLVVFWRASLLEGGSGRPWKIIPCLEFSKTPFRIQRNLVLTLEQRMNEGRWTFRGAGEEVDMNCFARVEAGLPVHRVRALMQPMMKLFVESYEELDRDAHAAYHTCACRFPEGVFQGYNYPDNKEGRYYNYLMGGELAQILLDEKKLAEEDDSQELHSELLASFSQAPEEVATQMPVADDLLASSTEEAAHGAESTEDHQVIPPPESQEDLFELVKTTSCAGGGAKKTPPRKGEEDNSGKSGGKSPAATKSATATAGTSRGGGGGAGKDDSEDERDRGKKSAPKGKGRRDSSEDTDGGKKKSPGKKRAKSDDSDGDGKKNRTPKKKPRAGTKAALQEENQRNKAELERKDELVQTLLRRLAETELRGAEATATRDEAAVEHAKAREEDARKEREDNERIRKEGEARRREAAMNARAAIEEKLRIEKEEQRKAEEAKEERKRKERERDEAETERMLQAAKEKREAEVRRAREMKEKAEREELQRRRMADEDSSEDDEPEVVSVKEPERASTAPKPTKSTSFKEPRAVPATAPMPRSSSSESDRRVEGKGEKSKRSSSQPRKRHSCAGPGQPPCRCETLSLDQIRTRMEPGVPIHEIGHMLAFGLVQLEDTLRNSQADTTGAVGKVQRAIESRDPQLSELKALTIKGTTNASYKPVTKDEEDDLGIPFATFAEFNAALNNSKKREQIRCLLPQVRQSLLHFPMVFINKILEPQLAERFFKPSDTGTKVFERFKYTEEHFVMPQVFCDMVIKHMRESVGVQNAEARFNVYIDQQRKDRRGQFRMHFWKNLKGKTYPNVPKVLWMVFVCNLRGWTFLDKHPAPIYENSGVAEIRAYWDKHRRRFEEAVKEHYGSMYDVPVMEKPRRIYDTGACSKTPAPVVPEPREDRSGTSSASE